MLMPLRRFRQLLPLRQDTPPMPITLRCRRQIRVYAAAAAID